MRNYNRFTARDRLILGLLCVAAGLWFILVAMDIIPWRRVDVMSNSFSLFPATGAISALIGIAIMTGGTGPGCLVGRVTGYAVLAIFAVVGNWIAFGPGPRQCNPEIISIVTVFAENMAGIECRIAFGIGAGLLDGFLLIHLAKGLRKIGVPGLAPVVFEKAGWGILFIALSPIVVSILLVLLVVSGFEAFREYRKTGHWRRKDGFLARMRRKRGGA